MVNDTTIICPKCKYAVKLTDAVAAPMIASIRAEAADSIKVARREIARQEEQAAEAKYNKELGSAKSELFDMQHDLNLKNQQLEASAKAHADTARKSRELDDAKREMDLTVEKKIQEGLDSVRSQARHQVEGELSLKLTEKQEQLSSMASKIESLKRQVEQGSQQSQGEALELELEAQLKAKFPTDSIDPVPKGVAGADITQVVLTTQARSAGMILWELKRTRAWSDGWLPKLREDQRAVKADIAVLVTQTLPPGAPMMSFFDGVWVLSIEAALPAAAMLRQGLFAVAASKVTSSGMKAKSERVYEYLTGNGFRQRVQAIVEAFSNMQVDLNAEKKAITKAWAKREKEIEHVMQSTVGMYGDLQGIAGQTFKEIEGLALESS